MTRLCAIASLLVLVGLSAGQTPTSAAQKKAIREGTHFLRRILFDHKFTSLKSIDELADAPRRSLLIALGDLRILDRVPGGLEKFVREGGAVLLASDRPLPKGTPAWNALAETTGVSISGDKLICDTADECYQGLDFCPYLQPANNPPVDLFANTGDPLARRLRVATNMPAMLFARNHRATRPVAYLPPRCLLETRGLKMYLAAPPLFAVAGNRGAGRVLVLADHSVFINEMMSPQDTNNVEFTYNCVRWLRDAGQGEMRDRVLVMEEGRPQTRLDLPMKSARIPLNEMLRLLFEKRNALLVEGERWLAAQEDEGPFGPRLAAALEQKNVPWSAVVTIFLMAGTLAGLLYLSWRVGAAERFAHDRIAAPLLQAVDSRLPDRPLVQQRIEAMLAGDAREPLRELARRLFIGFDQPPVPYINGWLARWRLAARLRRAWKLATGWPSPILPNRVARWQRELEDLQARRDVGEWGQASPASRERPPERHPE